MIVIRFWYIVSNVFVYLSCVNILVPGCRAANETDDAYAYSEEKTDLETFSPELTEPIPKDFFEGVDNKVGAFEDINGADAETSKSSDLCTESITTSPVSVMNQTNSTETSPDLYNDSTTNPVAPPTLSDAETKTADLYTESIPEVTTPLTTDSGVLTDLYNETTKPTIPSSGSDAATNTSDLHTDSITMKNDSYTAEFTESTIPSSGSNAATNTSDLHTDSITMKNDSYTAEFTESTIPSSGSDAATNTSDLHTDSITMKNDSYSAESTTESTISSSGSDALTNNTDLHTDSIIMKNDSYTAESTTKPVTSDNSSSESTTKSDFSTNTTETIISSTLSEQITVNIEPVANITVEFATNNASISEQSNVSSAREPDPQDLSFSPTLLKEFNELVDKPTQPLVISSDKDTLEQLYDEDAKYTTKFTPRYEEGYYDPNRAPTRYGQHEEVVKTTMWTFASDYTIGIRDYNLILYAVNNTLVLEKGSLLNYVYFVFKEILHVNMTLCDIRYCRYLRSKTHDNAKKVPPVLVAFTKMDVKNEILHKRKMLRPTGIKVEHDMPKKILDEQNALLKPLMDKYRAMGQYVVVRSGKLLVEGKVLTQINLPDKYTYDPLQTFVSYVSTTVKPTTTPGIYQLPREFADYGFGGDKKFGRRKKGGKGAGGKKKRKPVIRIPLDDEIGDELSVEVLFTTRKFW